MKIKYFWQNASIYCYATIVSLYAAEYYVIPQHDKWLSYLMVVITTYRRNTTHITSLYRRNHWLPVSFA